jgi:hypothetical protein
MGSDKPEQLYKGWADPEKITHWPTRPIHSSPPGVRSHQGVNIYCNKIATEAINCNEWYVPKWNQLKNKLLYSKSCAKWQILLNIIQIYFRSK